MEYRWYRLRYCDRYRDIACKSVKNSHTVIDQSDCRDSPTHSINYYIAQIKTHWPRQFLCCRVSSVDRAECIALLLLSKRWLRVRIPFLLILFFFKINVHIMYIALYSVRNKVKDWSLFSRQVALTNKSPLTSLTILRYKKSRPGPGSFRVFMLSRAIWALFLSILLQNWIKTHSYGGGGGGAPVASPSKSATVQLLFVAESL